MLQTIKRQKLVTGLLLSSACSAISLSTAHAEMDEREAERAESGVIVLAQADESETATQSSGGSFDASRDDVLIVEGVRRRATAAIETGASVQVLGGEQINDMAVRDVEQLTFYAPGTSVNGGQVGFLSIRGVGNDSFSAGTEGSSAFYVDGVYRPRITSVLTDVIDVERAEILRGPQGTQFGRNSLGGAINVIRKGPSDEFEAEAEASVGSFDMFRVQAGMGGPIIEDRLEARVFGMKEVRDGFIDNIAEVGTAPRTLDNKDVTAFVGSLDYHVSDQVTFEVRGDWLKSRDTGRVQPLVSGAQRLLDLGATIPFDDIRQAAIDTEPFQNIDDWGISGALAIDLEGWLPGLSLRSSTSRREFSNLFQLDGDLTDLNASVLVFDLDSKYLQHETLFSYDNGGSLAGIFGVFYFHEKADFKFDIDVPFVDNTPPPAVKVFQTEQVETQAVAVFADWKLQATENFAFNAGVRYSWEQKDHDTRVTVGPIGAPFFFSDSGQLIDLEEWTAFTPRIGLEYNLTDNQLLYGLVSRGFTAGNYSIGQLEPVDPEFAWNYEVGHKATFFDGALETSLSLFWMELRDLQVELIGENEFDVTTPVTQNIGEARNRGVEFGARAAPSDWLRIETAITYLDAVFQKGSAVIEIDEDIFQELTLDGKRQTQSPLWSASTGVEAEFSTSGLGIPGRGRLRFEHQYVGAQFAGGNNLGVLNRSVDRIDSVNVLNARFDYEFPGAQWMISVLGQNITDEVVISRLTGTEADFQIIEPDLVEQSKLPGDPRTWSIVLSFRY